MTPEVKLKRFEEYYGKIDFVNLLHIPENTDEIVQSINEDRLFQLYVENKTLYITSEFNPYIVGIGFFRAKRKYKDLQRGETIEIKLH